MYANESVGQTFPPFHYADESTPGSCDSIGLGFMWQGNLLYPEYLTDLAVNICPSDGDGIDSYSEGRWHQNGDLSLPINACRVDTLSYIYVPWALNEQDLMMPGVDPNDGAITEANVFGAYIDVQFLNAFLAFVGAVGAAPTLDAALAATNKDLSWVGSDGKSHTALKVREGVERFMITDINNAGASAKAQSKMVLQYDGIETDASDFNHVPGGANAIYMDGHVEFLKYTSTYPATRAWAALVGNF